MDSFETIYKQYASTVKKYVILLGANNNLSDDITAETFYKALKNINSYDESKKMLTWLCSIAKNTYFDYLKKKDHQNVSATEYENNFSLSYSIEDDLEKRETRLLIHKTILLLDNPYKDVVYMRFFADLSFDEIGAIFDKNSNWARVTFYRGKTKLKELLENEI